jgi:hypothetical protein
MSLIQGVVLAALACGGLLLGTPAQADDISCTMNFQLSGWSVFYKTASGSGTVRCSNGQSLQVKLRAKGGGLTFGKTEITDGIGKFSGMCWATTPMPRRMPASRTRRPRCRC